MIYFIVNEASGRGRAGRAWARMARALREMGVDYAAWKTHAPGEARALAALASREVGDEIRLVVLGGDGTLNEVLNGITDFERVALGIVPFGSGNDLARGLGLPKCPEMALERALAADGLRRIDIGEIQAGGRAPQRFAISAGVGMDAWVCEHVDASQAKGRLNRFGLGSFTYGFLTLSAAWHLEEVAANVCFETPGGDMNEEVEGLIFLACMNFPWEGGGVPIAPSASPEDGLFSVCMAANLSRSEVFRKLPLLALGRHTHTRGVRLMRARAVHVALKAPMVVHADGEVPPARVRDVHFRILPKMLRVLA